MNIDPSIRRNPLRTGRRKPEDFSDGTYLYILLELTVTCYLSKRLLVRHGMDSSSAYWVKVESGCTMQYSAEGVISGPPEEDDQPPQDLQDMADEQQEESSQDDTDSESTDQYDYEELQDEGTEYEDDGSGSSDHKQFQDDGETDELETVPFPNGKDALDGSFTIETDEGEKDYRWNLMEYPESHPSPGDDVEFQVEITSDEADLGDGSHSVNLMRKRESSAPLGGDTTFQRLNYNECTGRSDRCWVPINPATVSTDWPTLNVRFRMNMMYERQHLHTKDWYIAMEDN